HVTPPSPHHSPTPEPLAPATGSDTCSPSNGSSHQSVLQQVSAVWPRQTAVSDTISVSLKQPSVPAGFDRVVSTDRVTHVLLLRVTEAAILCGLDNRLHALKMIVKVQYRNQKKYIKIPEADIFITEGNAVFPSESSCLGPWQHVTPPSPHHSPTPEPLAPATGSDTYSPSNGSSHQSVLQQVSAVWPRQTAVSDTISVSLKQPSVPAGFDRVVSTDRVTHVLLLRVTEAAILCGLDNRLHA
ncbi:hypothetical protein JOQ06_025409, partial [Pogonophryne albipinna]